MVRFVLILMIGIAAASATPALAGEPTPTPAPEATPTAPPAGAITIRVIEDLNGDGIAQPDEPGLASWELYGGCSDAIILLTTDSDGAATLPGPNCLRVERPFGWFPTTEAVLLLQEVEAASDGVVFLLHNFGPKVMELRGEAIVQGLPAVSPRFMPDVPFTGGTGGEGCGHAIVEESSVMTQAIVIIEGTDTRDGCPTPGAAMDIVMNEEPAARATFSPGGTADVDLVVAGDSMRLYLQDVDGAVVITGVSFFNNDCAVIRPVEGFVAPDTVRVFVLSHEARSGCAAPGNTVIFTRAGENLQPVVPWESGTPEFSPPLALQLVVPITVPDTGTDIDPPDTGTAGLK